ncbi:MAG TPA: glycosyltransferase, partial [Bacteroidota bacterium]|nr:glycosyltransferase [Bacteroidota bacterium]
MEQQSLPFKEALEKEFAKTAWKGAILSSVGKHNRMNETLKQIFQVYSDKVDAIVNRYKTFSRSTSRNESKSYDILIPIYNAYEHVKVCIESVIKNTDPRHTVYLLDDASPDKRIVPLLNSYAEKYSSVKVLISEKNGGFIENMNRGFLISQNDVVILNSDTEVTENWIEKLDACANSNSKIGIVSPLSNNATILSVPEFNSSNKLPDGMSVQNFAEIVTRCSTRSYPAIPTAVGFCMLIKRNVLNEVGNFDTAFGLGYGEENDFCERAKLAGYEIVCCDDAYVHHYGTASFSFVKEIDERKKKNQKLLEQRWPNYDNEIFAFCRTNPLRVIQEKILSAVTARSGKKNPHVLHVLHSYNAPGGTELHTQDIARLLSGSFRVSIMYPFPLGQTYTDATSEFVQENMRVIQVAKENNFAIEYFNNMAGDLSSELIESNFANFVVGGDYDIIHFQHLMNWSSLLLPLIAKKLGKKVVISLHDYYLLCPEHNMIFPWIFSRCNKVYADPLDHECLYCIGSKRQRRIPQQAQPLTNYLLERHRLIEEIFEKADILIAPSNFVKQKFADAFGLCISSKIKVIPHGIKDIKKSPRPVYNDVLRIGFLGNLTTIKGIDVFWGAINKLSHLKIKFEIFGTV